MSKYIYIYIYKNNVTCVVDINKENVLIRKNNNNKAYYYNIHFICKMYIQFRKRIPFYKRQFWNSTYSNNKSLFPAKQFT
jgi:hypothetical protein